MLVFRNRTPVGQRQKEKHGTTVDGEEESELLEEQMEGVKKATAHSSPMVVNGT